LVLNEFNIRIIQNILNFNRELLLRTSAKLEDLHSLDGLILNSLSFVPWLCDKISRFGNHIDIHVASSTLRYNILSVDSVGIFTRVER